MSYNVNVVCLQIIPKIFLLYSYYVVLDIYIDVVYIVLQLRKSFVLQQEGIN